LGLELEVEVASGKDFRTIQNEPPRGTVVNHSIEADSSSSFNLWANIQEPLDQLTADYPDGSGKTHVLNSSELFRKQNGPGGYHVIAFPVPA
jgi:hypothetical protein